MEPQNIIIRGAQQHNLKNVDVSIPRNKLVVLTGVSGSGKSSLAFDTIYAEGQRRYVESLSSYARQFLGQMEKPKVDAIIGLSPAIAIEQKAVSKNPRSTVGTVTEIMDYLRVLFARVGSPYCPTCGKRVQPQSAQQIANQIASLPPQTKFQILAPLVRNRKGTHTDLLNQAKSDGFTRARINGELADLTAVIPPLNKKKKHNIELIVDRLIAPETVDSSYMTRLIDSIETTLKAADGVIMLDTGDQSSLMSIHNACAECGTSFPELSPQLFSFNSPIGMCPECNGIGTKMQVDPDLIITNPELSMLDGASKWHGVIGKKESSWGAKNVQTIADHYDVDLSTPWQDLPQKFRDVILYGSGNEKIRFTWGGEGEDGSWSGETRRPAKGVIFHINRLFRDTHSEGQRRRYAAYMNQLTCSTCHGSRLKPEAQAVKVGGKTLPEVCSLAIDEAHAWIVALNNEQSISAHQNGHPHSSNSLNDEQLEIASEVLKEIRDRLQFMLNVGLHYLTIDRPAPSLSGGEAQRIRLASQIGCGLVGVLYILDEPSIGLHARDNRALLDTLLQLRDMGNTVLVVEHDEETMMHSDWLVDLGPGAGVNGGDIVSAGPPTDVQADPHSLTGQYLSGNKIISSPNTKRRKTEIGWVELAGAKLHNLKNVKVKFPLGTMVTVTGVSGSGKSSLITSTLYPALAEVLNQAQTQPGPFKSLKGLEHLDKVINITQDPIGRTPRSNPATYIKLFDEIRQVFARTPDAKARGYKPGRFSFNVQGGRCEECSGYGRRKVEMHFLADVWVVCRACNGQRFNFETLSVTYKGANIADVLNMDVQEALTFFENHPKIHRQLKTLYDVGLEYIKLGQSALTLSGGEAQRIKLARELSKVATGRTIYILDEPTTGLHFADIQKLLDVLHRLVDAGNTVIVIEHNLDVIKTADWLIDLGPEGGEGGGTVIAQGPPEKIAQTAESYTGQFLQKILETAQAI